MNFADSEIVGAILTKEHYTITKDIRSCESAPRDWGQVSVIRQL